MLIVFLAFRRNVSILVVKHPKHVFVHYSETMKAEVPSYRLHQENIERGSSGSCLGAFGLVLMIVMLVSETRVRSLDLRTFTFFSIRD